MVKTVFLFLFMWALWRNSILHLLSYLEVHCSSVRLTPAAVFIGHGVWNAQMFNLGIVRYLSLVCQLPSEVIRCGWNLSSSATSCVMGHTGPLSPCPCISQTEDSTTLLRTGTRE